MVPPKIYERIHAHTHMLAKVHSYVSIFTHVRIRHRHHLRPLTGSELPFRVLPVSTPFQLSRMRVCNASCIRHTRCVDVDCNWGASSGAGCAARRLLGIRLIFFFAPRFFRSKLQPKERANARAERENSSHIYTHIQSTQLLLFAAHELAL